MIKVGHAELSKSEPMEQAKQFLQTGKPARVFTEFPYRTVSKTWSRDRRVVAKAEQIEGKENPRVLVTSLTAEQWEARLLYEKLYCARGEMENRIKDQLALFAGRMSTESFRGHQLRLYFSAFAYCLLQGLKRLGLQGSELETAQPRTLRLRLLKIAAVVRISVRRIWITLPRSYPLQHVFRQAHLALRC